MSKSFLLEALLAEGAKEVVHGKTFSNNHKND
jgi:hypothetical protein